MAKAAKKKAATKKTTPKKAAPKKAAAAPPSPSPEAVVTVAAGNAFNQTPSPASIAFSPPAESKRQLDGVPFDLATDFAPDARKKFADKDGQPGNKDPSKCKALLRFAADGDRPVAVFWSSKMAIDTDGPSAGPGRLNGKALDPASGQNDTSLHFANGDGLPSEIVPYIVLPQLKPGSNQTFNPEVAIGDMAIVIFKDKTAAAVCGDLGPFNKIGEASIRVHEGLQQQGCPDPCAKRDANGFCQRARNSSVEQDVLYFVFPNSAFAQTELNLETINTKVKERAFGLYNKLRGAS
jgi:Fungal chitosanase of glycosyl hydrolase group 75